MKYHISFFFILFTTLLVAQHSITITGKIIDVKNNPIPYATIKCQQQSDSSIISGGISEEDGSFSFQSTKSNFFITFSYAGLIADTFSFNNIVSNLELGKITMKPIQTIENIEIVGQKSNFEYHLDKKVFNVGNELSNQGLNASQILENIPSVTVDTDGSVSLRGNSNVRILIDGKMSGFTSSGAALQQLQGENIEKIEVITNASARYDAEGDAGIINIVLKKNKSKGINGSVAVKGGYFPNAGADLRLNYKKNKINFYTAYSFGFSKTPGYSFTNQHLSNQDTTFTYNQFYNEVEKNLNHYATAGMDYDINEYNALSFSFGIQSSNGKNNYFRTYENRDSLDQTSSLSNRLETQKELEDMLEASLGYRKSFKNKALLTVDAKWFKNQDILKSDYTEYFSYLPLPKQQFSQINTDENNLLVQTDFTLPFLKDGKFETGFRGQMRDLKNGLRYGEWDSITWIYPSHYNESYNYNENVYAAYAMASNTWKKFSLQLGLRAEYTTIATLQHSIQLKNKRQFLDLFPSAALSYKTTVNQTIQLSYSRRISRPGQWNLMPYMRFGDNRERMVGNPYLKPEYTNAIEAGILQNWKTGTFLSTIYYRFTTNKIERITSFGSDGIIYLTPYNIAIKNDIGAEFNITYTPLNWLRFSTNFNIYYNEIKGDFNGTTIFRSNFTWTNRSSIAFNFPKIIKAQIAFNYRAPSVRAQGTMLSVYHFDLGVSRDIIKGNATIGLNIRDLFNTWRFRFTTNTPEIQTQTNGKWRQRSIVLVFTYRFNQTKKNDFNVLEDKGNYQE
jgi:outer membrane receptor protein involved in Fe transport